MRSRYTAYARRDADYLLRTWHPTTRPRRLEFEPDLRWTKLEVRFTTGGSLFDSEGTVLFEAHYSDRGRVGSMTENSQFTKVAGEWLYVGAITPSPSR